jgi:arylsulfatase A-like enzyme
MDLMKCLFACWLGLFLSMFSAMAAGPNVLFIISDDLNAYCQYPLCGPSRNSMLTGLYPNSTGIVANSQIFRQTIPKQHSLSQAFRLKNYFAARIGKLYHYNVPKSVGTNGHDDPGSWELELNPAGCDRLEEESEIFSLKPGSFGGTLSWYASPNPDPRHTDAMLAKDAEWVLERCANEPERPFFLAVGFYRPHTPYVAPKSYFDPYDVAAMPVVQDWEEDQKDIPKAGLGSHKKEHDLLTDPLRRQAIQAYYASISFMDAQVGRVVATLDRLGLSDNTIIVFTSDHGYHMGEHGLWQKQSLFEQSARVPLLIVAPGVSRAGGVAKAPVGLIDLYPTLTELCDVPAPTNLQGQSLAAMLKDPSEPGQGWALTHVQRRAKNGRFDGYSLRTPRWRYTEWDGGKQGRELYDRESDPLELTNLAEGKEQAHVMQELAKQLQEVLPTTFPKSGKRPSLAPKTWAPNLTNP